MLCGEIQKVEVTLKNVGNAPLANICIASSDAKLFTLKNASDINKNEGKRILSSQFLIFTRLFY